jgi:hypothetical protein
VAYKFKADYEEKLQPLKEKLLPAMVKYEDYLKNLAGLSDVYTENSSPSLSALKTAMIGAGVVGVGSAAAGITSANISTLKNSSREALYYPKVNNKYKNNFYKHFSKDFGTRNFDNKPLKQYELENTFNKFYRWNKNDKVKVELSSPSDDKSMVGLNGYYDEKTNTVFLNKDYYNKWSDNEKIEHTAHEFFHAWDAKKGDKLTYYDIPAHPTDDNLSCYNTAGKIQRNNIVNDVSCSEHEKKYLTSPEESEARVHGVSAAAAFAELVGRNNKGKPININDLKGLSVK